MIAVERVSILLLGYPGVESGQARGIDRSGAVGGAHSFARRPCALLRDSGAAQRTIDATRRVQCAFQIAGPLGRRLRTAQVELVRPTAPDAAADWDSGVLARAYCGRGALQV